MKHSGVWPSFLLSGVAVLALATPATAQQAGTADATPANPANPATGGEIVVTGIRGSLAKSLEIKRNAATVIDSINATELGRFPDSDVADSLLHITGITINRTTGGEGQYVSVRGLGSQYNIVTLNDRILATDDDGRDFAFDILPADVISGADVLKSPQASAIEGSIGGTVNLRSARPFDHRGLHYSVRAEGSYNDMSRYGGYKVSGFVSNTSPDGTLGILVGAVYSNQKTRTDSLNYETYDPNNPGTFPFAQTQGGPVPANAQPVVALCCLSLGSVVDQKQRLALTTTIEWRPSSTLHVTIDGVYTRLRDPQQAYDQAYYPDFSYDQNGQAEWSNITTKNGFITGFTAGNFTPEVINQRINRVVSTYLIGANVVWDATQRLTMKFDGYQSRANRPEGGTDAFVTAGLASPTPYNQDTITFQANAGTLPNIAVTLPGGVNYATALASGALTNQSLWSTHYVGLSGYSVRDTINGLKADGEYRFDDSILKHIGFGINFTGRKKTRDDVSNDWTNGSAQYGSLYNTVPGQPAPITFATMGQNVISTFNFPNYFSGAGGSFPHTQVLLNINNLLAGLKTLNGTPNYTAGSGTYNFANTLPQPNPTNSYAVNENTLAGYLEASFGGTSWSGNIGVRTVYTHTTASTAITSVLSVTNSNTANPTNPGVVQLAPPTPSRASGNYLLPLPSFNFSYHPSDKWQIRLAGAEVIARPNLNQLAPTQTNNANNNVYVVTYGGNAALKPIKAWQADVSVEWYYMPRALLSVALFGKRLKDDITTVEINNVDIGARGCFNGQPCTPLPFSVVEPVNGDTAKIYGIEVGWQHLLRNGLGIRAQYTHTWSSTVVAGVNVGPEAGVSPTTFSINPFFEKGPISLSVSLDHSSGFTYANFTEVTGLPALANAFNWVTASASYEFTHGVKVFFEGKNLTNSIVHTNLGGNPYAVWASGTTGTGSSVGSGYSAYGRTVTGGVRISM